MILRTGPVCTGSVFWKICTGPDRIGFLENLYRIGSDFLYRILPFHHKIMMILSCFYHDFIDAKTSKISTQKHQKYRRKNIKNIDPKTIKISTQNHQKKRRRFIMCTFFWGQNGTSEVDFCIHHDDFPRPV